MIPVLVHSRIGISFAMMYETHFTNGIQIRSYPPYKLMESCWLTDSRCDIFRIGGLYSACHPYCSAQHDTDLQTMSDCDWNKKRRSLDQISCTISYTNASGYLLFQSMIVSSKLQKRDHSTICNEEISLQAKYSSRILSLLFRLQNCGYFTLHLIISCYKRSVLLWYQLLKRNDTSRNLDTTFTVTVASDWITQGPLFSLMFRLKSSECETTTTECGKLMPPSGRSDVEADDWYRGVRVSRDTPDSRQTASSDQSNDYFGTTGCQHRVDGIGTVYQLLVRFNLLEFRVSDSNSYYPRTRVRSRRTPHHCLFIVTVLY